MKIVDDNETYKVWCERIYYDKFCENILFEIQVGPIRTKIKFANEIVALTPRMKYNQNPFCVLGDNKESTDTLQYTPSPFSVRCTHVMYKISSLQYFPPCHPTFHSVSLDHFDHTLKVLCSLRQ